MIAGNRFLRNCHLILKKSMRNKIKKRWSTVLLFSSAQALFQTGSILVMALSGLVGLEIAPEKSLATLPIAMISVGTVLMMILASLIIKKMGQRKAFLIGTIIGVLAGMLSFYAILKNSFVLFVLGNTLIGVCQAFTQYYRFAAADSVPQKIKGKAISFVIGGGVVAAIAGPALVRSTQNIGAVSFAYSFLSISFLSIISFLVIFGLKEKKRITAQQKDFQFKQSTPLGEIMGQNKTILALLSSAVGYSVMIMIMTATPLAMHHCGYSGDDSSVVIQWHVLGMYVPFFLPAL